MVAERIGTSHRAGPSGHETAIPRVLERERATDMEAALSMLRRMESIEALLPGRAHARRLPALHIARELLDGLENPFARKLPVDAMGDFTWTGPAEGDLFAPPSFKEKP